MGVETFVKTTAPELNKRFARKSSLAVRTGLEKGVKRYEKVVKKWSTRTRPRFVPIRKVTSDFKVIASIESRGSTKLQRMIWPMIDRTGRKKTIITPKDPDGVLAFRSNYSPKTLGGTGISSGSTVFTKRVEQPARKPLELHKKINPKIDQDILKELKGVKFG